MARLDTYEDLPQGMRKYLSTNGWHFSKAAAEWAIGCMKDANGQKVKVPDKKNIDSMIEQYVIEVENNNGYDCVYVYCMLKSDFADVLTSDAMVIKAVKDYLDDPDGYVGIAMTRFVADCIGKGKSIPWEDLL